MFLVRRYVDESGRDTVGEWMADLQDLRARARINIRIARLATGNFGDCKFLRQGVFELRIDYGPGYRLYYARVNKTIILLLSGGDKRKQQPDIERAIDYLNSYKRRNS